MCILSFTYRVGQRAIKINMFSSVSPPGDKFAYQRGNFSEILTKTSIFSIKKVKVLPWK